MAEHGCCLEHIFLEQAKIQFESFGQDFRAMTDPEKIAYIREMVLATTHELHEAMRETGWKPWSASDHIYTDLYVSELVDALLLLVNLFLVTGVHAGDLASFVAAKVQLKQKVNVQRQESGYRV
jgi:hypothetical protein